MRNRPKSGSKIQASRAPIKTSRPPQARTSGIHSDRRVMGNHAVLSTLRYMPARAKELFIQPGHEDLGRFQELAKAAGVPVRVVDKQVLTAKNGDDDTHQGVVLACREFPYVDFDSILEDTPNLIVILDGVEDPRNLGRAARASFAFGASVLVIPKDRAAQVTATAEKAAVGALARLPVASVTNLHQTILKLKRAGYPVIGAAGEAQTDIWDVDMRGATALVIGSEEKGLRRLIRESCDTLVKIPMEHEDESLNAADATTVFLYEVLRQRSGPAISA
jgi:23S rRNA (guanosine2251-2'-O)-methyltransferase